MAQVTYVGAGTRATGVNGLVSPTLPAGLAAGDLMICFGAIAAPARNYPSPAGWATTTYISNSAATDGPRIFCSWKAYASGDTDPTWTTGGTSKPGSGVVAQIFAWRNADSIAGPTFGTGYTSGTTTGTDVGPVAGVPITGLGEALVFGAWASGYTTGPNQPSGWSNVVNQTTTGATVNVSIGLFSKDVSASTSPSVTIPGNPTTACTRAGVQVGINEGTVVANLDKLRVGSGTVKLYAGSTTVNKAYVGSTQIWP